MPPLTFSFMADMMRSARKDCKKFFAIAVTVPGSEELEIIINPMDSLDAKLTYYEGTYNEDLTHKHAPLKIVAYTCGDTFADIQNDMLVGIMED